MRQMPSGESLDSTFSFLREGYTFIANRCRQYETDVFQARLLFQTYIFMRGEEAANIFYDNRLFQRQGAAPEFLQKTLFGVGAVQSLDGEFHRVRKSLFMSLLTGEGVKTLVGMAENLMHDALAGWEKRASISLHEELKRVLCQAACHWCGVPLSSEEVARRAEDFSLMIEGSGSLGLTHLRGRQARRRTEQWISQLIDAVRMQKLRVEKESAIYRMAMHIDADGKWLSNRTAAVELINIIRPVVAISWYMTFAGATLHEYPHYAWELQAGRVNYEDFVQEVRRFYPFFPATVAVVKEDFQWKGYKFKKGTRVLLDLFGTNHDPRTWEQPEQFRPERFEKWNKSAFNFVPQGGGNHYTGHRCPGEKITIEMMKMMTRFLVSAMDYRVPAQDLTISFSQMPAIPKSGFVLEKVSPRQKKIAPYQQLDFSSRSA